MIQLRSEWRVRRVGKQEIEYWNSGSATLTDESALLGWGRIVY